MSADGVAVVLIPRAMLRLTEHKKVLFPSQCGCDVITILTGTRWICCVPPFRCASQHRPTYSDKPRDCPTGRAHPLFHSLNEPTASNQRSNIYRVHGRHGQSMVCFQHAFAMLPGALVVRCKHYHPWPWPPLSRMRKMGGCLFMCKAPPAQAGGAQAGGLLQMSEYNCSWYLWCKVVIVQYRPYGWKLERGEMFPVKSTLYSEGKLSRIGSCWCTTVSLCLGWENIYTETTHWQH